MKFCWSRRKEREGRQRPATFQGLCRPEPAGSSLSIVLVVYDLAKERLEYYEIAKQLHDEMSKAHNRDFKTVITVIKGVIRSKGGKDSKRAKGSEVQEGTRILLRQAMEGTPLMENLNLTLSSITSPSPKKAPQGALDARLRAVTPQASLQENSGLGGGFLDIQASAESVVATDSLPEVDVSKVCSSVALHRAPPTRHLAIGGRGEALRGSCLSR